MKSQFESVYIRKDGQYIEMPYKDYSRYLKSDESYASKHFLPFGNVLLEVTETVYKAFYKDRRRQKYLVERSKANRDFSYDMLTTDEFSGEEVLIDDRVDVAEQVMQNMLLIELRQALLKLSEEERGLIVALYFKGMTEREFSRMTSIPQKTINDRKHRILQKLRKILEK